jgi:hypothetical protein
MQATTVLGLLSMLMPQILCSGGASAFRFEHYARYRRFSSTAVDLYSRICLLALTIKFGYA